MVRMLLRVKAETAGEEEKLKDKKEKETDEQTGD